ncbi:MAG TPA: SRPBCC domain-containing protein [Bacteroidia bacterium]|nr:SRPBCC domain-containing protein [Bacteroidia bacterium]
MYAPLVIERTFAVRPDKIWNAITDKEKMKQWYFDIPSFKLESGAEFSFPGQGHKGEQYLHLCKITEINPLKKLSYTWRYKDHSGNSVVTFELLPEENQTRVRLTHAGLETFPKENPDFARSSFEEGWTQLIGTSLKNFLDK